MPFFFLTVLFCSGISYSQPPQDQLGFTEGIDPEKVRCNFKLLLLVDAMSQTGLNDSLGIKAYFEDFSDFSVDGPIMIGDIDFTFYIVELNNPRVNPHIYQKINILNNGTQYRIPKKVLGARRFVMCYTGYYFLRICGFYHDELDTFEQIITQSKPPLITKRNFKKYYLSKIQQLCN